MDVRHARQDLSEARMCLVIQGSSHTRGYLPDDRIPYNGNEMRQEVNENVECSDIKR